jgi:hypothetical protein
MERGSRIAGRSSKSALALGLTRHGSPRAESETPPVELVPRSSPRKKRPARSESGKLQIFSNKLKNARSESSATLSRSTFSSRQVPHLTHLWGVVESREIGINRALTRMAMRTGRATSLHAKGFPFEGKPAADG